MEQTSKQESRGTSKQASKVWVRLVERPKFWLPAVVEQWKMAPTRPETPEHGWRTQLGNDRNPEKNCFVPMKHFIRT